MVKYIIIHNKHDGCYDFQYYEDKVARMRMTSITINPPKLFLFDTRDQAQDFFEDYINDIDCTDIRCRKENDDIEHIEYCTCGIIELDRDDNPILFYNKKNQIFLLEQESGPKVFVPPHDLKEDIKNFNLTNNLIRRVKTLGKEQRKKYIELGKYCEDCSTTGEKKPFKFDEDSDDGSDVDDVNMDKNKVIGHSIQFAPQIPVPSANISITVDPVTKEVKVTTLPEVDQSSESKKTSDKKEPKAKAKETKEKEPKPKKEPKEKVPNEKETKPKKEPKKKTTEEQK
jgi:hypothetical protein